VGEKLRAYYPGWEYQLVPIRTRGDELLSARIEEIGGKGVFVREIEEALLRGEVDIAVHSLKDLPTELPPGLTIAAVTEREDPRDAFLSRSGKKFLALPSGARIGTSSLRREVQIKNLRPDIEVVPLRGNVPTRIRRMREGVVDGIVVAVAGLKRLQLTGEIVECFPLEVMLPAVGQGVLAIETRQDEAQWVRCLNHEATERAILAERAFLRAVSGSCRMPVAAWGEVEGEVITLWGMVFTGGELRKAMVTGQVVQAEMVGMELAERLGYGAR